ncbi:MAG: pyridoxamine 5'-phosphate oxidase family protein [Microthrixaceae bacterium]
MEDYLSTKNLDWGGLEVLSPDECTARLRATPVARLAFLEAGEPVILPINFAWHHGGAVFRTTLGSKLNAAIRERPVCLEVDEWDRDSGRGWSVVVKGVADEVLDDDLIAEFERLHVTPWTKPEIRTHWVRISANDITGREIHSG